MDVQILDICKVIGHPTKELQYRPSLSDLKWVSLVEMWMFGLPHSLPCRQIVLHTFLVVVTYPLSQQVSPLFKHLHEVQSQLSIY